MIKVENLSKSFKDRKVLDNVNLEIHRGETMVIMGGSGCGKSTMLRHMVGAIPPDQGEIYIDGVNIVGLKEAKLNEIRKKFGILFQSGALFNSMTVGDNIAFPLREHTELSEEVIQIIVKMKLELVGLKGMESLMPSEISGGMKKRVGLARAIAMDPAIVFYDEPGAGLDPIVLAVIDKLIVDLSKKLGITSVVVTHEMGSAFRIADRMAVLENGRILEIGTPEQIRNSKHEYVQNFIHGLIPKENGVVKNG